jgi:internalin A
MTKLKVLEINFNVIKSVPPEIGQLRDLNKLGLSGCGLTELPPTIGELSQLQELKLEKNRLSDIPMSITKIKVPYILRKFI